MPNYTTTQHNVQTKELLDAVIQSTFEDNMTTMKRLKREAVTEPVTSLGRQFVIKTGSNESYGAMTSESGAFPAAGRLAEVRATISYRSQFKSFGFSGDVEDLATNHTLQNSLTKIVRDSTESFDAQQGFFLFGSGDGVLGQIDSVSSNDITMLCNVTYPYGANAIRQTQLLNAYDVSGAAYRSGDMTVSGVTRSTHVVAVDTAAASIASDDDDVLVFKGMYNYAPYGFKYHIADSGTWLTLSRTTNPGTKSLVYDASSASIDWDLLETVDLRSRTIVGDSAPKFDKTLIMHPAQHKYLRATARSSGNLSFNANVAGNKKMDLLVTDVTPGGQEIIEDSNCGASDVWGVNFSDWALEEVAPRQLYKHSGGDVFIQQIASATAYGDAKEGRVYWRYNPVCKAPYRQYRIKNLSFNTADIRIQRA